MPAPRNREHTWTRFELHTMLCLIARGVHLEQRSEKRTDTPTLIRHNAYENFYTALNDAVNLKEYTQDIHKKEVTRMLDQMLKERKSVIGKGGLVERQVSGRVTRSLRMAWNRTPAIGFDGSLSEWNRGRKEKVLWKWKIERGLIKDTAEESDATAKDKDTANQANLRAQAEIAATGASGCNNWRDTADPIHLSHRDNFNTDKTSANESATVTRTNLDSFCLPPSNFRTSSKYDWADLNIVSAKDGYARHEKAAAPTLKRAGRRTRVLSSVYAHSSRSSPPERPSHMPLPYESYRPGATSGRAIDYYASGTPRNPIPRQDRGSAKNIDNSLAGKSSVSDVMDEYSGVDMSLDFDTLAAAAQSNSTRIESSDMSLLAAFNAAFEDELASGIEKDLTSEYAKNIASSSCLGKDVGMSSLEADLEAALEADVSEEE